MRIATPELLFPPVPYGRRAVGGLAAWAAAGCLDASVVRRVLMPRLRKKQSLPATIVAQVEAQGPVARTPYRDLMPTEAPSPFVRLSRDIIFSRAVLCRHLEEEPFSLSGSTVRSAPRPARNTAQERAVRLDAAPPRTAFPLLSAAACPMRSTCPTPKKILSARTHAFLIRATTVK
jgi:hypothetical protein